MKNRIAKERIIFDNYDLFEQYPDKDIIEWLLEDGGGYVSEEEITEEDIMRERCHLSEINWEDVEYELKKFFMNKGDKWLLVGTIGRWDGCYKGGFIFETFEEMFNKATKDCYYWKFYDENGHLYLTCSHHDGTCNFEIKEITDKGYEYYENWNYGSWNDKRTEEYVHTQIMNKYSRLPRFAERVYGCPKVEYEPITKESLVTKLNNQAKSFYC